MRDLFILLGHLLTRMAKLLRFRAARAVVADSAVVKQQLLVVNQFGRCRPTQS